MLEIFRDFAQGTDGWRQIRSGIPTASEFQCLIARGDEKKGRATYMRQLAGERLTGEPMESFQSGPMGRGKAMEDEARRFYAFAKDVDPEIVAFIRNGDKGCSPDSLIGADGGLEIKTERPDILIDTIFKGEFPNKYKAQTQGFLWVAEREWVDLLIFYRKMPTQFLMRAYRDVSYIATLARAVAEFNEELEEMVDKLRRMGGEQARAAA